MLSVPVASDDRLLPFVSSNFQHAATRQAAYSRLNVELNPGLCLEEACGVYFRFHCMHKYFGDPECSNWISCVFSGVYISVVEECLGCSVIREPDSPTFIHLHLDMSRLVALYSSAVYKVLNHLLA